MAPWYSILEMHDSLHNQFSIKVPFDGMQNFIINDTLGKDGPFLAFSLFHSVE